MLQKSVYINMEPECPDVGMRRICRLLPGNYMITDLVLSNARYVSPCAHVSNCDACCRITSGGLRYLCDALTFMNNVKYLDLSQNCIDDAGMDYFSEMLGEGNFTSCPSLKRVTFLGNRITIIGARTLLHSALTGSLEYIK